MTTMLNLDSSLPTRELLRILRVPPFGNDAMPESYQWQVYIELRRRGENSVGATFIQSVKALHRRRALGAPDLPVADGAPDEHRLSEDPYLGELWRSYKRCLSANRTGPAAQILRELEQQVG